MTLTKTMLITGGAGFIGSNFTRYWASHYPQDLLIVLDALTYAGNLANLHDLEKHPHSTFVKGSINDANLLHQLFIKYKIDTIVNFAAESHVDRSIKEASLFMQTNIMGTYQLLNVARFFWLDQWKLDTHRFHQISTDEVFGDLKPNDPPFTETNPYQPNSPYAASKAAADHLVKSFHATYGLKTSISHCSNNYGPYQHPEKLIPLCITHLLQNQPISIYGDGQQIRDWLHVQDHCRAIELILQQETVGSQLNIGSSRSQSHQKEITNLTLVHRLCQIVEDSLQNDPQLRQQFPHAHAAKKQQSTSLIQAAHDRPGHDRRYAIDATKIEQTLNFQAKVSLEMGLKETVFWYLSHPLWWKKIASSAFA